ncbi:MAG: hypothetical protein JWL77_6222 [Chthonomonadaceae bacterium]|nr:hypothetical protein [Chthonomonadaceae bacterium]
MSLSEFENGAQNDRICRIVFWNTVVFMFLSILRKVCYWPPLHTS